MDWFFIDEFLNQEICEGAELYLYGSRLKEGYEEYVVEDTGWRSIKKLMARSLAHSGIPLIQVMDGDYSGKRELYLRHSYEGLPLDEDYARNTLKQIHVLWDRPVHLETVEVEGKTESKVEWCYDGRGLSKTSIGETEAGA